MEAGAELNRPERRPDLDALLGGAAPDRLSIAALLYLTLPGLIFLPAWLLPWVAAPGAAAGIAALVLARGWHKAWPLTTRASLLCLLGGLAWAALSGAPHFVYSTVDWQIRDAVLSDLAQGAWPVGYHIARQEWLLRAPLGYYMPAALLGQVAGFGAAQLALWAWTGIGLGLVLALLTCLARAGAPEAGWRAVAAMVALFLVFGGLDLLPNAWLDWSAGVGALASWGRGGEWWDRLFQYSGHVTLLLWAPNHALPAWLPLLLLLRHARSPDWMRSSAALLLAGAAFWSPLSAFGAAALMAVAGLRFGLAAGAPPCLVSGQFAGRGLPAARLPLSHRRLLLDPPRAAALDEGGSGGGGLALGPLPAGGGAALGCLPAAAPAWPAALGLTAAAGAAAWLRLWAGQRDDDAWWHRAAGRVLGGGRHRHGASAGECLAAPGEGRAARLRADRRRRLGDGGQPDRHRAPLARQRRLLPARGGAAIGLHRLHRLVALRGALAGPGDRIGAPPAADTPGAEARLGSLLAGAASLDVDAPVPHDGSEFLPESAAGSPSIRSRLA
jgi:hypothetical protein